MEVADNILSGLCLQTVYFRSDGQIKTCVDNLEYFVIPSWQNASAVNSSKLIITMVKPFSVGLCIYHCYF